MRPRVPFPLGGVVMSKQLEVKPQQRLEVRHGHPAG
jgi:hypothetical protein